jgi:hypothetical protein
MDPRVKAPGTALEQQFQLQTRLAGLMNQVAPAVLEARSVREQLDKVAKTASGATAELVKSAQEKVKVLLEGPENDGENNTPALSGVNGSINTLYEQVGLADAAPTAPQMAESTRVAKDAADVLQRWNEFKTRELSALNQQLKSAGSPEINPQQTPQTQPDEGDED